MFSLLFGTTCVPSGTDLEFYVYIKYCAFCNIGYFALSITLTVPVLIDDFAEVDYSLNSLPAVFRQFIDLDLKVIACSSICQDWCGFNYCMIHFLR